MLLHPIINLRQNLDTGSDGAVVINDFVGPLVAVFTPHFDDKTLRFSDDIRDTFEAKGFLIQEWDKVQTDMLTIIPSAAPAQLERAATAD